MRVGRTARIFASVVGFRRGLLGGRARNPRKPLAEATGDDARPSSCGRFINRAVYFPGVFIPGVFIPGVFIPGVFIPGVGSTASWVMERVIPPASAGGFWVGDPRAGGVGARVTPRKPLAEAMGMTRGITMEATRSRAAAQRTGSHTPRLHDTERADESHVIR